MSCPTPASGADGTMSCPNPASLASSATCSREQFWCIDTFAVTTMEERLEEVPEDAPGSPHLPTEQHQGQGQAVQQLQPHPNHHQRGFQHQMGAAAGTLSQTTFPCLVRPQVPHQLQPLHVGDDDVSDVSIDDQEEQEGRRRRSQPGGAGEQRLQLPRRCEGLGEQPGQREAEKEGGEEEQLGERDEERQQEEQLHQPRASQQTTLSTTTAAPEVGAVVPSGKQKRQAASQRQTQPQPQPQPSSLLKEASMLRLETQLARSEAKSVDLERRFEELERELRQRARDEEMRKKSHEEEVQTLREQIEKLEARCEGLVEDKPDPADLRDSAVKEACEASRALGFAFEDSMTRRFAEFRDEVAKLVEEMDDQQGSSGDRLYAIEWALARNGIVLDQLPGQPEELLSLKSDESELEKWKQDQDQQKTQDLELDRRFQLRLREELAKLDSLVPRTRKMGVMDSRRSCDGSDLGTMTDAAQAAAAAAAAAVAAVVRAARGEAPSPKAAGAGAGAGEEKACEFFSLCPEADESTLAMASTMTTMSTQAQTVTNVAHETEVSRVKALVQEHEHQFDGIADTIQSLRDELADLSRNSMDRCESLEQQSYEVKVDLARLAAQSERSLETRELAKALEARVAEQGHVMLKIVSRVDDAQARWISAERSFVTQEAYHADKKDTLEDLIELKATLKSVQRELQQAVAASSSLIPNDDLRKAMLRDLVQAQTMGTDHLVQQERHQTFEGLQTIQQQLDLLRRSVLFAEKDDHSHSEQVSPYPRESKERRTQSHPPSLLRNRAQCEEAACQHPLLPLQARTHFVEAKAQDSKSLAVEGTPSTVAGSLHKGLSGSPESAQASPAPRSVSCPEASTDVGPTLKAPPGGAPTNMGGQEDFAGRRSSNKNDSNHKGKNKSSSKSSASSRHIGRECEEEGHEREEEEGNEGEDDEIADSDTSGDGQPLAAKVRKLTGTILATESAIDALAMKLLGEDASSSRKKQQQQQPQKQQHQQGGEGGEAGEGGEGGESEDDAPAAPCPSRMRPVTSHAEDLESVKSSLRTMAECVGAAQGAVGALVPRLRGQSEVRFEEFSLRGGRDSSRRSGEVGDRKLSKGAGESLVKEIGAASLVMKEPDLQNTPTSRSGDGSPPTYGSPPLGRREVRCDACWPWLLSDFRR